MNNQTDTYIIEIRKYKAHSIYNMLKIGEVLCDAKINLDHGEWLDFLKNPFIKFTLRTAQRLMQLHKCYGHLVENDIDLLNQIGQTKLLKLVTIKRIKNSNNQIDSNLLKNYIDQELTDLNNNLKTVKCIEVHNNYPSDDYIAGLLDGEGCLGMYPTGGKRFSFILSISNTNKEILQSIQTKFNQGKLFVTETESKPIYSYNLSNPLDIKRILSKLKLFIKHKEKQLLLKAINLYVDNYSKNFKKIAKLCIAIGYLKKTDLHTKSSELYDLVFDTPTQSS